MELHSNAQDRIETAMERVFGLEDEAITYEDATVGTGVFVVVQTDDDTIYIDIGFDNPPSTLPDDPSAYKPVLSELIDMLERAYLRVQKRRTSFDFEPQSGNRPTYRVTRPLVVEDESREQ